MTKNTLIRRLIDAGYHGDLEEFTKLYVNNDITRLEADRAYTKGRKLKLDGVECVCKACSSN